MSSPLGYVSPLQAKRAEGWASGDVSGLLNGNGRNSVQHGGGHTSAIVALADYGAAATFRRQYARRLRTGCVYQPQPADTYGALLLRRPRFSGEYCHYHEWCPGLAPRDALLIAYHEGRLSWQTFAARYLAELSALPLILDEARRKVARVLDRYPTLTFLGTVPAGIGMGGEASVHCHRRLLRAWLLGEAAAVGVCGLDIPSVASTAVARTADRTCRR